MQPTIHSVLEFSQMNEMHENLRKKLTDVQRSDLGRMDSLRSTILSLVVSENYQSAQEELVAYIDLKEAFPLFQERAQRYLQHCQELIQAIETKRNFPGLATLSMAKQQEVHEKVLSHFEDLKSHLQQIERVERESRLTDVRSTVWVVKALAGGIFSIFLCGILLDYQSGQFDTAWTVFDHGIDDFVVWIFQQL